MNKPFLLGVMCLSFECPELIQPPCEQECLTSSQIAGSTPPFPMPLFLLPGYGGTDSLPVPRFEFPPVKPAPPIPPFQPPIHPPINPPIKPEPEIPQQPVPEPNTLVTAVVLGLIGLIYSRTKKA